MKLFPFPFRITGGVLVAMQNASTMPGVAKITLAEEEFRAFGVAVEMEDCEWYEVNDIPVYPGEQNTVWLQTVEGLSIDEVTQVMDVLGSATANAGRKLKWQMKLLSQHTRN